MRTVLLGLACLVAACSSPAPPPAKAPSQKVARAPVSSVPTCADMGPLLRGAMDDEEHEGPKKEAIIIAACERDRWPAAVLACAASATEPTVQNCLDDLPDEMHASYDKALAKYNSNDEGSDGGDADTAEVTCDEAFAATAVDAWPPAVTVEAERALAIQLRGPSLRKVCDDDQWSLAARQCIADTPASGVSACLDMVDPAEVRARIAAADELRAAIVKARSKPSTVTCEKAVAAHYGANRWASKAPELKGAARTSAIAAAKKAMLAACKAWSIEARACIVTRDSDECYALAGSTAARWAYPPTGPSSKMTLTGIAECDDYALAVELLSTCPSMTQASRDALMDAYNQSAKAFTSLSGDQLAAARSACKAAADATRQAAIACT